MISSEELKKNYDRVRATLDGARAGRPVMLIAVSKGQPVDAIAALYALGHRDFGENYVQELSEKAEELMRRGLSGMRWHFIGHLQTNKVKQLVESVSSVHSIDSEKVARELAKRWKDSGGTEKLPVFLEVNIDREASKSGVMPEAAPELARVVAKLDGIELRGLMCVPSPGAAGRPFVELRELEAKCRPHTKGELSMGMSGDFESAVREGATHVRVGTLIFGARA